MEKFAHEQVFRQGYNWHGEGQRVSQDVLPGIPVFASLEPVLHDAEGHVQEGLRGQGIGNHMGHDPREKQATIRGQPRLDGFSEGPVRIHTPCAVVWSTECCHDERRTFREWD